jgi:hypothetical protein
MHYIDFSISKNNKLSIYIPPFPEKTNLYYKPSSELQRFDEVKIFYVDKNKKILLLFDIVYEILFRLSICLERALKNNLTLPCSVKEGLLGKKFNIITFNEIENDESSDTDDFFSKYWLFSDKEIQTWIYNVEEKICIEISPSYKWFYQDPKPNEKFISFQSFMENYKTFAFFCIDKETAKKWKQQYDSILKEL